jgi:hypothetical protein
MSAKPKLAMHSLQVDDTLVPKGWTVGDVTQIGRLGAYVLDAIKEGET